MKVYPYIPFRGELSALTASGLAGLREIGAGWYVAYEESLPGAKDLAKHLAAFANHSGGWLFIGITGDENNGMRAGSFAGVTVNAAGEALARLREAARTCVTPEVCFETKILEGPAPELNLPEGQSIIVVGVPQGGNPPYIHASGKIYRRAAEGSAPALELDRHAVDLLSSRRVESQQRLAGFLSASSDAAEQGGGAQAKAHLYLLEDPFLTGGAQALPYEAFSSAMLASNTEHFAFAGFSTFFTTPDGYIAKLRRHNEALAQLVTFRWWNGGNARISIPVSEHFLETFPLYSDPQRADFARLLRAQGLEKARVADLSQFLATLAVATAKYLHLRSVAGLRQPFWAKTRFYGCRGIVPFINLRQYVEIIKVRGIPHIEDDDFYAPPGITADTLVKLEPAESVGISEQGLRLALRFGVSAFRAVGIDFDGFAKEDPQGFLRDLAQSMNGARRS
jgi:hypothetical protein